MPTEEQRFGMTERELAERPTAFAPRLFAGKTALISGGGSGIGKAAAWLWGRLGARVIICGRRLEQLQGCADAMCAAGLIATATAVDIRKPTAVNRLMDEAWERFGGLDVLFNNAGGQFPQAAIDLSPNGWRAVIDNNLNGTWFMMQAAAVRWRNAGQPGTIVNMVTVTERGMPDLAHTCAARAGVIHLSKTVAVEWAPLRIRVNCIAPGVVATEGMRVYPESARAGFADSNAMRRFASAWEIAEACTFLASDASSFMTGEVVSVDGGGKLWGDLWPLGRPEYFDVGAAPRTLDDGGGDGDDD